MKRKNSLFRPADAILIAGVLLLAGVLFFRFSTRGSGATVQVEQNGKILYTVALSGVQEPLWFSVGGECPVVIGCENGEVWFERSECPDQLCVRSGHLHRVGEIAACLPAGVVVRIVGDSALDGTTG